MKMINSGLRNGNIEEGGAVLVFECFLFLLNHYYYASALCGARLASPSESMWQLYFRTGS